MIMDEISSKLIKIENGTPTLSTAASVALATFERKAKEIKEKEDALKKAILKAMEDNNIVKVETDEITVTYIAKTDRETFQKKAFRKDNPDLYDDYVKITPVKPSIRIKIK